MSHALAALIVLGWLANQAPIGEFLNRWQHPMTTTPPEEGNR